MIKESLISMRCVDMTSGCGSVQSWSVGGRGTSTLTVIEVLSPFTACRDILDNAHTGAPCYRLEEPDVKIG